MAVIICRQEIIDSPVITLFCCLRVKLVYSSFNAQLFSCIYVTQLIQAIASCMITLMSVIISRQEITVYVVCMHMHEMAYCQVYTLITMDGFRLWRVGYRLVSLARLARETRYWLYQQRRLSRYSVCMKPRAYRVAEGSIHLDKTELFTCT